jgi:hypothetical protein
MHATDCQHVKTSTGSYLRLQDGVVLVWRSSDPMLQAHEASGALAGRTVVGISAGRYECALADVYKC